MKIVIDTDPGIDDALALMMALNSPDLEILGSRGDWTRTSDLVVPNDARYRLRHTPTMTEECCRNAALGVPNDARYRLRHTPTNIIVALRLVSSKENRKRGEGILCEKGRPTDRPRSRSEA